MSWRRFFLIAVLALGVAGCRTSAVVAGNLATMAIVVVMLWSTLHMDRS